MFCNRFLKSLILGLGSILLTSLVFQMNVRAEEPKIPSASELTHPPRTRIPSHPQRPRVPHGSSGKIEPFMEKLATFKSRLKEDPKDVEALIFLANANFDIQRFENAESFYLKVLEIDPNNLHVRTDLASVYRNLEQPEKAVKTLQVVLSLNPNHEVALYNIGVILLNDIEDKAGAADVWERLIRINPGDPLANELKKMVKTLREDQLKPVE